MTVDFPRTKTKHKQKGWQGLLLRCGRQQREKPAGGISNLNVICMCGGRARAECVTVLEEERNSFEGKAELSLLDINYLFCPPSVQLSPNE
jgi:hypothetical protein